MKLCPLKSIIILVISLFISQPIIGYTSSTNTTKSKSSLSFTEEDATEIRNLKDVIVESQKQVDDLVNENMASQISSLNRVLSGSAERIISATQKYEDSYSRKGAKKLLNEVSKEYDKIISSFNQIPEDFLLKTRDVYENAVFKGKKISDEALKRNKEDYKYKRNLIHSRKQAAKNLAAEIRAGAKTQENITKLKRIDRDIKRLQKLMDRQNRSAKQWAAIGSKFDKVLHRMSEKMASVETSILAFNQLHSEFKDQKAAIDQMLVLMELDELSTAEFEGKVDSLMTVSDTLFSATDRAFSNVFTGILEDTEPTDQNQTDSNAAGSSDAQLEALLNEY